MTISSWLSMQLVLLQFSIRCHGFGLNLDPQSPIVHFSDAGPTTSFWSRADPDASIVSQISPFQSSALSWLENEMTPGREKTASSSIPLSSQLIATTAELATASSSSDPPPASASAWTDQILNSKLYRTDKVKRVIDACTIQFETAGCISLESVRGVGTTYQYQLPDCMTYAPSYKLKELLPEGTMVRFVKLEDATHNNDVVKRMPIKSSRSSSTSTPRVWIVREKDGMMINQELIRTGFAIVRVGAKGPSDMMDDLIQLEQTAREKGLGMYESCSAEDGSSSTTSSEFEPLPLP